MFYLIFLSHMGKCQKLTIYLDLHLFSGVYPPPNNMGVIKVKYFYNVFNIHDYLLLPTSM